MISKKMAYREQNWELPNKDVAIELLHMKKKHDREWNEKWVDLHFAVSNFFQASFEIQAKKVIADSAELDETMVFMSEVIASDSTHEAVLSIQNYHGALPKMEEYLDIVLHVYSCEHRAFNYEIYGQILF